MDTKVEKVTNMGKDSDQASDLRNEHLREQTRARINQNEELNNNGTFKPTIKEELLPVHTKNTFSESFNKVIRAMISPNDEQVKKRWFTNDHESIYELIIFYFYRSILTLFFLIYSIYALFDYSINRSKIKFLSMAYKSNDDPSIINADINKLPKIPQRLSTILNYKSEQEEGGGIEGLCNDGASIAAWCVSSGIPSLSIYEVNGILKKSIPEFSKAIFNKFESYFGTDSVPNFLINIPHLNISYSGIDGVLTNNNNDKTKDDENGYQIQISLLSKVDGRSTIVELTKVMAQLTKSGELKKSDITIKFLDHELKQLIGEEPDLIILFQPYLDLQGYPPWHIRLTEMYWEPDNDSVSYVVFLRALQKYSTCKVNIGR
jgi:dehydrodolichyl diphosphate syntase complex subunit NUS1